MKLAVLCAKDVSTKCIIIKQERASCLWLFLHTKFTVDESTSFLIGITKI
jgi:hypothetical protein